MADETYGRGQMEWALWRSFTHARGDRLPVPKVFTTRIKRLMEIDRNRTWDEAEAVPESDYAFAPPPSPETGESSYAPVDAFCLAVALDLLDAGFKQAEIVFLMRFIRTHLEERFPELLEGPSLLGRKQQLAKLHPELPSYQHGKHRFADNRVFMLVHKVELTEVFPTLAMHAKAFPVFLEPIFCEGIEALGVELGTSMPNNRRVTMVLEIAATAQAVDQFLREAPVIRRGRPKG